ncbi:hypothetical protein [Legionella londiniensis]|uniref:UDP-N-acetylmuramyl tripeptide synthase n=1 Tax=Legionella londiniensis TaxID=45068 RepID=A0A0W0VQA4_9GAMM|nr:hypothetical protein [Legionella londiniensis]KTD21977.1 UDP-N-acetylmuramyl tripeptide synthase [Legionella londiniensis]STX94019.1 UDP-N-acetylmuramyl tripeptide synthase [Legionella londiniensis]
MDKNLESYYKSALQYLLPVTPIPKLQGFVLNLGKNYYYFFRASTPFNSANSADLARNKYYTFYFLHRAGIPIPHMISMSRSHFARGQWEKDIQKLRFPLVAKPCFGTGKGQDVLCNIKNFEQLKKHLDYLFKYYDYVNIEEYHGNLKSYRVLVFRQKVIGVVHRMPAFVEGDGKHTIRELIEITNKKRQQENDILKPILIDTECEISLEELGLTLDSIPEVGKQVRLGFTSNATRGGSFKSIGKKICKENRELAIKIARVLDLKLVGIDLECEDITIPVSQSRGVVIEVNDSPSVRIHEECTTGKPVAVTRIIMRYFMFRHPFSYCWRLILHPRVRPYIRAILIIVAFYCVFILTA